MIKDKGITLISLVVTIIILIILAGVSINLLMSENGIINKAKEAKEKYELEKIREEIELAITDIKIENADKEFNMKTVINSLPQKLSDVTWNEEVDENTEEPYGYYKIYEFLINKYYKAIILGVDDSVQEDEKDEIQIDEYVQSGLQVYLDAKEKNTIENNIWKDISGKQNNAILNGCTVGENKVTFDGVDDWANLGEQNFGNVTLEVIFDVNEFQNALTCILGNYEAGGYGIDISSANTVQTETYVNGAYVVTKTTNSIDTNTKYKVTLTSNGKETKTYINGEFIQSKEIENGLIELPDSKTVLAIGANPKKDISVSSFFNGSVYLVRAYNRVLSETEIKLNYNYDNNRFNISENYFKDFEYVDDTYKIASVSDFETFRDEVNNGNTFEGRYIQLQDNLNLSEITSWIPIGTTANPFKGLFDGNGYDITNLNIDNEASYQGLFGSNEGIITSVNIKSGTIKGVNKVGAIAGNNSGNIINCSNSATIDTTGYHVGGICGYNLGNIQKSYNTGNCSAKSTSLAGIAGRSDCLVKFCYNTGIITGSTNSVGGVVGTAKNGIISSCYNTANVITTGYNSSNNSLIGGILGGTFNSNDNGGNTIVKYCYNTGNVTGEGGLVGGIVGSFTGDISYCYNTGTVIAKRGNTNNNASAAGIVGSLNTDPCNLSYCYNIGHVECQSGNKYPGGIAGYNESNSTVKNSYTLSTVISTVIGNNKGTNTNTGSKTMAEMQASDFVTLLGGTNIWQVVTNNYPKLYWE